MKEEEVGKKEKEIQIKKLVSLSNPILLFTNNEAMLEEDLCCIPSTTFTSLYVLPSSQEFFVVAKKKKKASAMDIVRVYAALFQDSCCVQSKKKSKIMVSFIYPHDFYGDVDLVHQSTFMKS